MACNPLTLILPIFSGEPNTDPVEIESLLALIEHYAELQGLDNISRKNCCAKILPFQLRGDASRMYRTIQNKGDWDEVKMHMITMYGVTKLPISVSYPLLASLKQISHKNVSDYYQAMMKAAEKLEICNQALTGHFIGGLNPPIKSYVQIRDPTTLIEALQYAKVAEATQEDNPLEKKIDHVLKYLTPPRNLSNITETRPPSTSNDNRQPDASYHYHSRQRRKRKKAKK